MAFGTSRPGDPAPPAASPLREALHRVLAGDLAGAEAGLAQAARVDSSSIDLYLALATVYRARGDIGRAIQIHQNLLLRQELPTELRRDALLGLAQDFQAGGFLRRSAASFRELLEVEPKNLDALFALERIYIDTGDWLEALQVRRRIGSKDPRTPSVRAHLWTGLGKQHVEQGRESEAQRAYRRALSSDRRCIEAYVAFGDLRMRQQRPAKALHLWKRALATHPSVGRVLFPRIWEACKSSGDLASLLAILEERRAEADEEDPEVTLWWARAKIEAGDIDDAVAALGRLLDRNPSYFPAYAEIGRALLGEGRDAESIKAFEQLITHLPVSQSSLRCKSCGTRDVTLHWRCPQCGVWDSYL